MRMRMIRTLHQLRFILPRLRFILPQLQYTLPQYGLQYTLLQ